MISSRHLSNAGRYALFLLCSHSAMANGGFLGIQSSLIESRDMDSAEYALRITFGPKVTERLSLEMALMDMGKIRNDDPTADFTGADSSNPPVFSDTPHGSVRNQTGAGTDPSSATYTGFSALHPQSLMIGLSYRYPLSSGIELLVKGGANLWWADYESVTLTATSDGNLSRRTSNRDLSAMDSFAGAGLLWKALPELAIRAEIESMALDSKDLPRSRFRMFTLGLQYEF